MTLIVKMMSGENFPDDDSRKSYKIKSGVLDVEFAREPPDAYVWLWYLGNSEATGPEKFLLAGNCYVMNEAGKTVSSFGVAPPCGVAFRPCDDELLLKKAAAADVISTLDGLAVALAERKHKWTIPQRHGYETSIRVLGGNLDEHLPLALQKKDNNRTRGV